ncbi:MAG: methyltransferase domain-containing protein [Acidobacteriota bacterium]
MKRCLSCHQLFDRRGWICPECGNAPEERRGFPHFAPLLADENDQFVAEAFSRLAEVEPHSFWFRERNQNILWALGRYFPDSSSVCELGCGTAFVLEALTRFLPDATFVGCEVFTEGLVEAGRRLEASTATGLDERLSLLQLDGRNLPFEEHFDLFCAFDVLEHIEEDEVVLGNAHRALRPRGGLLITVPQHPFLWSHEDDYSGHQRRYRRKELVTKVEGAGFEVLRVSSFVSLLLPLLIAQRAWSRFSKPPEPGTYALRPAAPVNAVFGATLKMERALLRLGGSWPAGGARQRAPPPRG